MKNSEFQLLDGMKVKPKAYYFLRKYWKLTNNRPKIQRVDSARRLHYKNQKITHYQ